MQISGQNNFSKRAFFLIISLCAFTQSALAQKACTEIGCVNSLTLKGDETRDWKNGNYNFDFVLDNRRVRCWGELPLKPCEEGPSLSCNKPGVSIVESGCALPKDQHAFGDIHIDGEPRRVMVRITHNNKTILTRSVSPQYQKSRPNGTGCGPVCSSASYNLFSASDPE